MKSQGKIAIKLQALSEQNCKVVVSSTTLYYGSDNFGGTEQDLITALFCTGVDQCAFHTLIPVHTPLVGTQREFQLLSTALYKMN